MNPRHAEFLLQTILKERQNTPERTVTPRITYDDHLKEWHVDLLISLSNYKTKVVGSHYLDLDITQKEFEELATLLGITRSKGTDAENRVHLYYGNTPIGRYRVLNKVQSPRELGANP